MNACGLTDEALVATLKRLVVREREATAAVLEHLAEVDARKLYLRFPASSMTTYCCEALGYSEHAAGKRVTAARLVRRFPQLLAMVRDGQLHLTALSMMGPHLTPENVDARAAAAGGTTKLQLEDIIAGWAPKADVPNRISEVVPPVVTGMLAFAALTSSSIADTHQSSQSGSTIATPVTAVAGPTTPSPSAATPTAVSVPVPVPVPTTPPERPSAPARTPKALSPGRYKLELTIDGETRDALMKVRDHLRHAIPDGDYAKIVAKALKELLAKVEARKFGKRKRAVTKAQAQAAATTAQAQAQAQAPGPTETLEQAQPEQTKTPEPTQTVTAEAIIEHDIVMTRSPAQATRREVAERDGYQCTWVGDDGRRCSATQRLEMDHVTPWCHHGLTDAANLRLLCATHHRAKEWGTGVGARQGVARRDSAK